MATTATSYAGYENLCRELNKKVLGKEHPYGMPPSYNLARFEELFGELERSHPGVTPRELYFLSLRRFAGSTMPE